MYSIYWWLVVWIFWYLDRLLVWPMIPQYIWKHKRYLSNRFSMRFWFHRSKLHIYIRTYVCLLSRYHIQRFCDSQCDSAFLVRWAWMPQTSISCSCFVFDDLHVCRFCKLFQNADGYAVYKRSYILLIKSSLELLVSTWNNSFILSKYACVYSFLYALKSSTRMWLRWALFDYGSTEAQSRRRLLIIRSSKVKYA